MRPMRKADGVTGADEVDKADEIAVGGDGPAAANEADRAAGGRVDTRDGEADGPGAPRNAKHPCSDSDA